MIRVKSIVNPNYEFSEETWVVSLLNTGRPKWLGHSVLIIEGLIKNTLNIYSYDSYFRQYDIQATLYDHQGCFSSKKGYIEEIRESIKPLQQFKYDKLQSRSWYITSGKAKGIIQSVEDDVDKTDKAQSVEEKIQFQLIVGVPFISDQHSVNCTKWALEKLAVGGIGDGSGKAKPKLAVSSCLII